MTGKPPTPDGLNAGFFTRLQCLQRVIAKGRELHGLKTLDAPKFRAWMDTVSHQVAATFGEHSHIRLLPPHVDLYYEDERPRFQDMRKQAVKDWLDYLDIALGPYCELLPNAEQTKQTTTTPALHGDLLDVFISHSSEDKDLAEALVNLLRAAMEIDPKRIRCTSVDGYKLDVGDDFEERLREELMGAKVFVALLTPDAFKSNFTLMEMGARWGAKLRLAPIRARGADPKPIGRPLTSIHIVTGTEPAEITSFVTDTARRLNKPCHEVSGWLSKSSDFVRLAQPKGTPIIEKELESFLPAWARGKTDQTAPPHSAQIARPPRP